MQGGDIADTKPALCKAFSNLADHYEVGELLGDGAYAKVYGAVPRTGGARVAVKVIPKRKKGIVHAVRDEIDLTKDVPHPGVVRVLNVLESEMEVYVVTELLEGGNLLDRVVTGQIPTERIASNIFRQLLFAVRAVHSKKIIHRDLKPQNILFVDTRPSSPLKLIDFGGSVRMQKDLVIDKQVGTVKYMAPEMVNKREYTTQVDLWSLGVVLYLILSGLEPFGGQGTALFAAIRAGKYDFPSPAWDPVSTAAKNLVTRLLEYKPEKRMTADEAAAHPWVAREKDRFLEHALPDLRGVVVRKKFVARPLFVGATHAVRFIRAVRLLVARGSVREPEIYLQNCSVNAKGRTACIKPGRISRSPQVNNPARQTAEPPQWQCALCGEWCDPVEGVRAGPRLYHPGCLLCAACGDHIREGFVTGPDGEPYHGDCLTAPHTTNHPGLARCHGCGKQCPSGINALGRVYHDTCFVCRICRVPITEEGNYEEEDGEPHHRSCLQRLHAQEPWRKPPPPPATLPTGRPPGPLLQPDPPATLRASYDRGLRSSAAARALDTAGGTHLAPESVYEAVAAHPLNRPVSAGLGGTRPRTDYRAPMRANVPPSSGAPPHSARRTSYDTPHAPDVLQITPPATVAGGRPADARPAPHHLEPLPVATFTSKFCSECGARHPNATSRFCVECGTARV